MGDVVRMYIGFLILFIPIPLVLALFCSSIPNFLLILKMFFHSYSTIMWLLLKQLNIRG